MPNRMGGPGGPGGMGGPGGSRGQGGPGRPSSMGSSKRPGMNQNMSHEGMGPHNMGEFGRRPGMDSHMPGENIGYHGNMGGMHQGQRPPEPPHMQQPGAQYAYTQRPKKKTGILGTLIGGLAAGSILSNGQTSSNDTEDTTETTTYGYDDENVVIKPETMDVAAEIDYSEREGYPATCPQCGAPTTGKKKCEYCDSLLI